MKKILLSFTCLAMLPFIYSCSKNKDKEENITIFYFDKSLMGTWVSETINDTIYVTFSSTPYSRLSPYFEQINWKPSKRNSDNIKEIWYYQWVSDRTIERRGSVSDTSSKGERVNYKISEKEDSLFFDNKIYTKNNNILSPL